VAVEEMIVTDGGQPRRIDVPVEVPEGVNNGSADPQASPSGGMRVNTMYNPGSIGSYALMGSARVVTKSGTNAAKAKRQRAGGGGGGGMSVGMGSGSARGSSARIAGVAASNAPPASPMIVAEVDPMELRRELSPREKQRAELAAKLHPSILAVIDRLQIKNPIVAPDELKFVRDGKAEIQIWLTDKSAETLAKLQELGFEVVLDPKSAKLVIGRLPIEKLGALAELKFVRYVAPQAAK
jgi:hypothetical protein